MRRPGARPPGGGQQPSGGGGQTADKQAEQDQQTATAIRICLDELLDRRGMTLTELSTRVGVTIVNLSVLKNGHARAIRFSTLAALCAALDCQPGDLLAYQAAGAGAGGDQASGGGGGGS